MLFPKKMYINPIAIKIFYYCSLLLFKAHFVIPRTTACKRGIKSKAGAINTFQVNLSVPLFLKCYYTSCYNKLVIRYLHLQLWYHHTLLMSGITFHFKQMLLFLIVSKKNQETMLRVGNLFGPSTKSREQCCSCSFLK